MSQVVAQLFQMRLKMKNLLGSMQGGSGPELSNIEAALKSEQKVFFFLLMFSLCVPLLEFESIICIISAI